MASVRGRQWAAGLRIVPTANAEGQTYHQRRVLDDGELVLLVNTDPEKAAFGTITTRGRAASEVGPADGQGRAHAGAAGEQEAGSQLRASACGSLLVFLPKRGRELAAARRNGRRRWRRRVRWRFAGSTPTAGVDYVDATCKGETRKDAPVVATGHWLYEKHGLMRDPWDRACVQGRADPHDVSGGQRV